MNQTEWSSEERASLLVVMLPQVTISPHTWHIKGGEVDAIDNVNVGKIRLQYKKAYLSFENTSTLNPMVGTTFRTLDWKHTHREIIKKVVNNPYTYSFWLESVKDGSLSTVIQSNTDHLDFPFLQPQPRHKAVK